MGLNLPRFHRARAALSTAAVALVLSVWCTDGFWIRQSYDWLFRLRPAIDVRGENVVLVEMDTESESVLQQGPHAAWDRSLHAELIRRLAARQVAAVAFDVVFSESPAGGVRGSQALQQAGTNAGIRVLFGARLMVEKSPTGELTRRLERSFGEAGSLDQVGLVETSFEPDGMIRKHFPGDAKLRTLAWRLYELTTAAAAGAPDDERWVNYYGPPGRTVARVSYWQVLSNTAPASVRWNGATVFVGGNTLTGYTGGTGADFHPTPFGVRAAGVEINALTYLNLQRGDWIRRWPRLLELFLNLLIGAIAGWHWSVWSPRRAAAALLLAELTVIATALACFWGARVLYPWVSVAGGILPLAAAWGVFRQPAESGTRADAKTGHATVPMVAANRVAGRGPELAVSPGAIPLIPDHAMLRCVGRGAYGQVWLARSAINTYHAVKVIYRDAFPSPEPFEREFRGIQVFAPISRHHPGWVHILHVGRNDAEGYFFYVMELGDDEQTGQEINPVAYRARSLARMRDRNHRLTLAESVRLGAALAEALDYLHGQLLVHRDIKPSNVIFHHGEPKFADIGTVTGVQSQDHAVSHIGTPGFIAPEGPGTAAADLFSLGKLLYEIWTGCDRLTFPVLPATLAEEPVGPTQQEFQALLALLCHEDAAKRPRSAAVVRDTLRDLQKRLESECNP